MKNSTYHIVLAEDDRNIAEIMKLILSEEGYIVTVAQNKQTLDEVCKEILPHIIFLDIRLGGESGEEIARELRGDERTSSVPLIMLSADDQIEVITQKVGADDFLMKPFELTELTKMVKKHLKH